MTRRILAWLRETVRRYFVAGVLFFAPIGITIWAIASIVVWLDNLILPHVLKLVIPGVDEPPALPLIGMLFTFVVIILLGVVARHLLGGEFLRAWERLMRRVPVARNIYSGVKQLFEAIFASGPAPSSTAWCSSSTRARASTRWPSPPGWRAAWCKRPPRSE
jgi:uncharacterized membrane protein